MLGDVAVVVVTRADRDAEVRSTVTLGGVVPPEILAALRSLVASGAIPMGSFVIGEHAGVRWAARLAEPSPGRWTFVCAPQREASHDQEHAESESRSRAMLEAISDGVWVVDADFRTTWSNRALRDLLGYSEEEMRSASPLDLVPVEDREGAAASWRSRRAGETSTGESRVLAKNGGVVWLLSSSAPILGPRGEFLGAIAIVRDVTSKKEDEERSRRDVARLHEVQRLEVLARLAGGIAHDFNNLLTAVLTGADILSLELPPPHAGAETVETIRQAGRRAAVLCRQLLGLSGRGRFSLAPVDVHAAASDAVLALRASLDSRHVVTISRGGDVPAVAADEAQLQQLVTNLILNASEAIGPRPGNVRLRVELATVDRAALASMHLAPDLAPGTHVCLRVTDDGPGLADDVRSQLFEPFVSTRTAGRGLGLPAVLGIVRGHRGAIRVESEPGRGTTFEVFFPVAQGVVRATPPRATEAEDAEDAEGSSEVVLVIDDEPMVRTAACRVLESSGFRTLSAHDGASGVALFREHAAAITVVLLDLSMPGMDGVETLVRIRAVRPGTPAVIMSGYAEDEAAARFVGVGLASFLAKPFTPDELLQRLKRAIASRPQATPPGQS